MANQLLSVSDVSVSYGDAKALWDVSVIVEEGRIVALLGSNGAGKSTLIKTISGLLCPTSGRIEFMGEDLCRLTPQKRVEAGIVQVPEGRRLFPTLSVLDNLKLGAYLRKARAAYNESLERVFGLFPILKERMNEKAGLLSGGEQQMLAIGRALMAQPVLLMIDEASLGLSPIMTKKIFDLIVALHEQGITILMVEQNVNLALRVCSMAYILKTGTVAMSGTSEELLANEEVWTAYIGQRGKRAQ